MMTYPELAPTTEELEGRYAIDGDVREAIAAARQDVGNILLGREAGLVAVVGPCALTGERAALADESGRLKELDNAQIGLKVVHRLPPWKPRTNPEDWHGLETTDPELAYAMLADHASWGPGTAIEVASVEHLERYGDLSVFNWTGGRNIGKTALMRDCVSQSEGTPLGIKNGLDGNIYPAIRKATALRSEGGSGLAPVIPIYRGGENAQTPEEWEERYLEVLQMTGGRLMVDIAHGTEMAHDPNGIFGKSVKGQELALEHVIALAEKGHIPTGIMIEASDAKSPTDPLLPFNLAVAGVTRLHVACMAGKNSRSTTMPVAAPSLSADPWAAVGRESNQGL